jgi:hypothetical protein
MQTSEVAKQFGVLDWCDSMCAGQHIQHQISSVQICGKNSAAFHMEC